MVALLIGVIFFGQVLDQDGVMNMNGSLFLFLTNMTFQNVFAVINVSNVKWQFLPHMVRRFKVLGSNRMIEKLIESNRSENWFDFFLGFRSRTSDLHSRVTRPSLSNQHLLFGKNDRWTAAVPSRAHHLHLDCLPNDRPAWRTYSVCQSRWDCVARRKCLNIVRLPHLVCELIHFHGFECWTPSHHSVFDIRRLFPQLRVGAGVFWVAIVPFVVPLWKWGAFGQSMGRRRRHYMHALQHNMPIEWKSYLGHAKLQSSEYMKTWIILPYNWASMQVT